MRAGWLIVPAMGLMLGCRTAPTGAPLFAPGPGGPTTAAVRPAAAAAPAAVSAEPDEGKEIMLLEKLHRSREDYRKSLEGLAAYYTATGNGLQAQRAREELGDVRNVRKYSYTVEPELTRTYTAREQFAAADTLYWNAHRLYAARDSREEERERLKRCVRLLQDLLARFPTSDKCDEALVLLGRIHEHRAFADYPLAARYYVKAFEADPDTETDAYMRAAHLYEARLRNAARAAEIYALASQKDPNPDHRALAARKVQELAGN
jgi:hypothetical protein